MFHSPLYLVKYLCQKISDYQQLIYLHTAITNKKAVLSQRWPRDAPYIWVPWKFLNVP